MERNIGSITENERIVSLDIMRGLAVFGIFLVNMMDFHSPINEIDPHKWFGQMPDQMVYSIIDIFAQASFYPLFSMLFGYGLVIFRERALKREQNFTKLAYRRLSMLLSIGTIHAFLIWNGDILITYAIFGFLALFFLRFSGKTLLLTGVLLYTISHFLLGLMAIATVLLAPDSGFDFTDMKAADALIQVYQRGDYIEITKLRVHEWYELNNLTTFPFLLFTILPLFLIGAGAGKIGWFSSPVLHVNWIKKMFFVTFPLGLLIKCIPYFFERNYAADYFQDIFGGAILAISYACLVALLTAKPTRLRLFMPLSAVGKLSLTNYLIQSSVSTFIFYGYGLGYYGKVTLINGTLIASILFLLQVLFSNLWIKGFHFGPVEWVWRAVTYWEWPKLKKT